MGQKSLPGALKAQYWSGPRGGGGFLCSVYTQWRLDDVMELLDMCNGSQAEETEEQCPVWEQLADWIEGMKPRKGLLGRGPNPGWGKVRNLGWII